MADRETHVYKAKLAEQAERYDGKFVDFLYFVGEFCVPFLPGYYHICVLHRKD